MAWIRTIDPDDAEGRLAELYRTLVDPVTGGVDHIMTIHSLSPNGLAAHAALYRHVMRGTATLPRVDREMIALVVSRTNGCHY